MFLLFNKKLFNCNLISQIERVVDTPQDKYGIQVSMGRSTEYEWYKNPDSCNRRFSELCDHVGCVSERGY